MFRKKDEDGNPTGLAGVLGARYGDGSSGAFNTPEGASGPGPLLPGSAYTFSFSADPGSRLTFATMFVQSNDWFYAPGESGIALWGRDGEPVSGDITSRLLLWDAGTEVDQPPGVGPDQAPRQSGADTGASDLKGRARRATGYGNVPPVSDVLRVTVSVEG